MCLPRAVLRWLVGCSVGLVLLPGCGERRRAPGEFVPAPQTARRALETALEAWKAGTPRDRIDTVTPPIIFSDAHRKSGQTLRNYEILGEVPGEGPRWFAVRLDLQNPTEELKVRYGVIGIDPLWVVRKEDYDMVTHWEHHPPPDRTAPTKGSTP